MRFSTTSELSGGERAGDAAGTAAVGVAAAGVALEAAPCANEEPVNRNSDAQTRTVDKKVRREAELKMGLLDVGVSRSVPEFCREARDFKLTVISRTSRTESLDWFCEEKSPTFARNARIGPLMLPYALCQNLLGLIGLLDH
jgi:hypothetical protein